MSSRQVANKVVHHKEYYLRGGDIIFLVENHLFRVHSYFFDRESTYFHNKLSTASGIGTSDADAFTLENVRSVDFERFLWVFYNPKYSLYDKSVDEWTSILGLSNEWSFVEVKALAVRELEKLEIPPIEKIFLYNKYSIDRAYLITSYGAVCIRPDPINLQEGTKLGLEVSLKIAEARERVRTVTADKNGPRSPTFADFASSDVEEVVRAVFNISAPTPISATATTPGGLNGLHSRSNSNSTSNFHGASPQSPISLRPSTSNFGLWTNAQSPINGFESRAGEQSPVNGTAGNGSQFPQGGTGEPPLALVVNFPPADEAQGGAETTDLETPVGGVVAKGSGAEEGEGDAAAKKEEEAAMAMAMAMEEAEAKAKEEAEAKAKEEEAVMAIKEAEAKATEEAEAKAKEEEAKAKEEEAKSREEAEAKAKEEADAVAKAQAAGAAEIPSTPKDLKNPTEGDADEDGESDQEDTEPVGDKKANNKSPQKRNNKRGKGRGKNNKQ